MIVRRLAVPGKPSSHGIKCDGEALGTVGHGFLSSLATICAGMLLVGACSSSRGVSADARSSQRDSPCVPPPVAIVGQKIEIGAEFVKIGKASYSVNPTVVKLAGDSAMDVLQLDYSLCNAVQNGMVPRNDAAAQEAWIRLRLEYTRKDGAEQAARGESR
jgi:hypothetical protein